MAAAPGFVGQAIERKPFVSRLSAQRCRAGGFIALLRFNGKALEWISALKELDESEILSCWTNAFLDIRDKLYISDIETDGMAVFCVTYGGHATLVAHGPQVENAIVPQYLVTDYPSLGFAFNRTDAVEQGLVSFDARKNYYTVQSYKKNVVYFYRIQDGQMMATVSLTPKRNLGPYHWKRVALAFNGKNMIVCGKDGFNRCELNGEASAPGEWGD